MHKHTDNLNAEIGKTTYTLYGIILTMMILPLAIASATHVGLVQMTTRFAYG